MRKMKDSNIQWVGQIPINWQVEKNKHCFKLEKNIVGENMKDYNLLSLTKKGVIKKDENSTGGKVPESFETYQSIKKGQMVMCLFDLDVSAVFSGLSSYEGMISPAYKIYNCNKNIYNNYAKYWFQYCFDGRKYKAYSKSLRYVVNTEDFEQIDILLPPREEQEKIANFIDKKVTKIDDVIEKTKETIEDYKKYKQSIITEAVTKGLDKNVEMKDSGIDWYEKIPNNYKVVSIKSIFRIYTGATPKTDNKENWDGNIAWITPSDYKTDEKYVLVGDRTITEKGYKSCGTSLVPKGSLIFSKRAPIGTVAISKIELCTNQGCLACVKKNDEINVEYYYYMFSGLVNEFNLYGTGTTFKEISTTNFSDFKVLLPSKFEQNKIVDHLNKKIENIDNLIERKVKIIEELEQYKKSLIYEYVTGKKEVI